MRRLASRRFKKTRNSPSRVARQAVWRRPEVYPVVRFTLCFGVCWGVALGVLALAPRVSDWAVRGTVASLLFLLRVLAIKVQVVGSSLSIGGYTFIIGDDCTSLTPTAGLWAAMIAFQATVRWKLIGLAVGAILLWVFNVLRILLLVPIYHWAPTALGFGPSGIAVG